MFTLKTKNNIKQAADFYGGHYNLIMKFAPSIIIILTKKEQKKIAQYCIDICKKTNVSSDVMAAAQMLDKYVRDGKEFSNGERQITLRKNNYDISVFKKYYEYSPKPFKCKEIEQIIEQF